MKQIKSVKLGINKNADVVLVADVEMGGEEDIDTLFLCYFTILTEPPNEVFLMDNEQLVKWFVENKVWMRDGKASLAIGN